jgi:hypothetical protein
MTDQMAQRTSAVCDGAEGLLAAGFFESVLASPARAGFSPARSMAIGSMSLRTADSGGLDQQLKKYFTRMTVRSTRLR